MPDPASSSPAAVPAPACRGLILDFGGVLTTPMRRNGEAFERAEGLTPGAYFHALGQHPEGVRVYADLEVGRATQEQWNHTIAGILGIDAADLMRRALAHLQPEEVIVDFARRARRAGVKVAMLSNSFGLVPFDPYRALDLGEEHFDAVVLSERAGVRKPATAIYQRTLEALGLPASACVFVDDHAANLPPAAALGMHTVHHLSDPAHTVARLEVLVAC